MAKKKGSIALNLFGFSLVWLVVALALTAFLLSNLYSRSLEASLKETLEFHLESLVGAAIIANGELIPSNSVADPRFLRPASGWYWQVSDDNDKNIKFSPSLVGSVLPKISSAFNDENKRSQKLKDSFGVNIFVIERKISFENSTLFIRVSGNLDEIYLSVKNFRGQALIVLGAVGIMLALMSYIIARFALRPLAKISLAIEEIRGGDINSIEGEYPKEIAPLAEEINELLASNTKIVERAKNQVGNLAHGLKTPLAVLQNEFAKQETKNAKIVRAETKKMTDIVSTYLNRAQMSARSNVVGKKTDVEKTLLPLVRVMEKLYPKQKISLEIAIEKPLYFRGEKNDFEEIIGNIVENACKWANSKVMIIVSGENEKLNIIVKDDGLGLNDKEIKEILLRGVRLDEKVQGSGLGLDIVKELVDVYSGSLSLTRAKLGGLKVELSLPIVKVR